MTWYTEQELRDYLRRNNYSDEIALELADQYAKNLQASFEKGRSVEQNRKAFILDFLRDEVRTVKTERQAEVIAGNIVKEALWQGEWSAYRKIIGLLHNMNGDDTYLELLKEI